MLVEYLAKELHEAGREAVERKKTVVASLGLKTPNKFLEWDDLTEEQKDGRRFIARRLLHIFKISLKKAQ
ncbi:hypothetical protein LCGC14_1841440 [marine sediment metagenome]|uniref:Uncharacterized protein n=1 Tax=marine sediment metagenome TaxID=412755 RepID=A0A0F9GDA1_9ZZZZ